MRVIISLTSYPPRIKGVHKVIESLYRQTVLADEIILYLSNEEFPGKERDIPFQLKELLGKKGFRIEWVGGNLKSHKKYYYSLKKFRKDIVITIDDDKIYADTMISELVESCYRFPNAVSARLVRMIVKTNETLEVYNKWKRRLEQYVDIPRTDLCAIGAGGVCYPPFVADDDWFHMEGISKLAESQDDLWLKYNEIISDVPIVYVKSPQEDVTIKDSQTVRLTSANLYENENDKCINELLTLMRNKNPEKYEVWFQSIMSVKEYYRNRFKMIIESVGAVRVYLYGAGKTASIYMDVLEQLQLTEMLSAVIVTVKAGNPSEIKGVKIIQLDEVETEGKIGIIFGVGETKKSDIQHALREYDYQSIPLCMEEIKKYYIEW